MRTTSDLRAKTMNRIKSSTITEMEDLKSPYPETPRNKAIDECIAIVKKKFVGWTE